MRLGPLKPLGASWGGTGSGRPSTGEGGSGGGGAAEEDSPGIVGGTVVRITGSPKLLGFSETPRLGCGGSGGTEPVVPPRICITGPFVFVPVLG